MTFIQAQIRTDAFPDAEEVPDDMIPESILLVGVSIASIFIGAGGDPSMVAIPGSMLAAFVALLKATQEKRQWTDKGIVVIGTSLFGTTLPSVAVHIFWPQWLEKLTWHVFLLAGFLSGLVGWMFAWAGILVLDQRREKIAKAAVREMERRVGLSQYPSLSEDSTSGTQSPLK